MTSKEIGSTFACLVVLVVLVCTKGGTVPAMTVIAFDSGHCAGCIPNAGDRLFTFTVNTHADFDSLTARCFSVRTRDEWFPPRPTVESTLVYVSLEGAGCKGCLNVVNIYETTEDIVVEVAGGFQGECDKLIISGAWAVFPRTGKRVVFRFRDTSCSDEP